MAWKLGAIIAEIKIDVGKIKKDLSSVKRLFVMLGKTIKTIFRGIARSFNLLMAPFKFLKRQLISLPGLLAAFAAYKLTGITSEALQLERAFVNLQASIGEVAETTLVKLRKATKGTVSDMKLMEMTNNAVLLGVGKAADDFAMLAEGGRRLGAAVGRSATEGFNDLVVGIGRQSRMILDNLGIIVETEKAYKTFADSLGKTSSQLTDNQKKYAFYLGAVDAVQTKIKALGPDVESVASRFGRFHATLDNLMVDVGKSFIPAVSRLFSKFGEFITDNRMKVQAWSEFINSTLNILVDLAFIYIDKIEAGTLNLSTTLPRILEVTLKVLMEKLEAFWDWMVEAVKPIAEKIGIVLVEFIFKGINKYIIQNLRSAIQTTWEQAQSAMGDVFAGMMSFFMSEDSQKLMSEVLKHPSDRSTYTQRIARQLQDEERAQVKRIRNAKNAIVSLSKDTKKEVKSLLNELFGEEAVSEALAGINKAVDALIVKLRDNIGTGLIDPQVGKTPGRVGIDPLALSDTLAAWRQQTSDFTFKTVTAGMDDLQKVIKKVNDAWEDLITTTDIAKFGPTKQLAEAQKTFDALKKSITDFDIKMQEIARNKEFETFLNAILDRTDQLQQQIWGREGKGIAKEIENIRDAIREFGADARTTGAQVNALNRALDRLIEMQERVKDDWDFGIKLPELGKSITQTVGQGLLDGFKRGESAAKTWTSIVGQLWTNAMNRAIDQIANNVQIALSKMFSSSIFGNIGLGGLASGLMGIGGMIWQSFQQGSTSTIEDFDTAITSSEAMRGVVAGPSNVAIATVSDSLKLALRDTEMLLTRIANAVEGGGFARSLSTSTTT